MAEISINILNKVKKVHFIGIGGIGMSGIAEYLLNKNISVQGSDIERNASAERLEGLGAKLFVPHNAASITDDIDAVVYTSAVKKDNEEYIEAERKNILMLKRAEMLGHIVNDKYLIAVSGTHGKTTTSAMISKVMIDAGFDPTVFVGGSLSFLEGGSSRTGSSKYAIVEADEYDRSFHTLKADTVVITNLEFDHSDIYKDIEDIKSSFKTFAGSSKKDAVFIAYNDDKNAAEVIAGKQTVKTYGFTESSDYRLEKYCKQNAGSSFNLDGKVITLSVSGKHNALNASAAYLAASAAGVTFDSFAKSIRSFTGVGRRLELKYKGKYKVYDDYAHHPTEIKATIEAVPAVKGGRIIMVFQPHLYSRTRDFHKEFAKELSKADKVYLVDIYPAREKPIAGVSSRLISDDIKNSTFAGSKDELFVMLEKETKENDTIIFTGAGSITNFCEEFINRIKE